jgi:hypothetical protein
VRGDLVLWLRWEESSRDLVSCVELLLLRNQWNACTWVAQKRSRVQAGSGSVHVMLLERDIVVVAGEELRGCYGVGRQHIITNCI